ncbi:MAG TPA: flavoprotein [Pirellulaceae bacterium]|nr:flavoprotein [Pirellulaceae bacterium]HMO91101.1 flavoprotein [Pirellulaceae bacterium]HMP70551.1 flavoprotein [Pirellulaceae bacterium]
MKMQRVLLGVCGGIAAYKTAQLTSRLVQAGYEVQVMLSDSARQFIGEATFAALSGRRVVVDMFDPQFPLGPHIELARSNDILCIAPATANFIAKAALGLADDLLSTTYLCFKGPVLIAPAMNVEMWSHPAVQLNVQKLREHAVSIVEPGEGWLSCRVIGKGRMAEAEAIFEAIASL